MYADRTLTCVECSSPFTFTAEEQEFHARKGFTNEPKRCPTCRANRRALRSETSFPSRAPREMHTIVCASCGKEAEVPFLPRGDRPVYCSDCYNRQRSARGTHRW